MSSLPYTWHCHFFVIVAKVFGFQPGLEIKTLLIRPHITLEKLVACSLYCRSTSFFPLVLCYHLSGIIICFSVVSEITSIDAC
ncbi:hypothetical protein GLYMA_16G071600v4 [Glycine max]|uniref:Uncharacterized protein n=1 Tax=Glycine max TaxID=3847 RepID=A0A0R0FMH2_SOYBN|nr:hypothetical protein JHK85_045225 [Glycine max]KAG5107820.1 hypothetical protein JHK84_044727 [Glycine max]KAH1150351.1 hypothetical protein GYH30_044388 [Glycine max]KRH07169.1 hypothetical protein GLYMA_16G071600v4 [Glycine max]